MPFIPHTKADIQSMLDAIGVNTIEDLFSEIPADLRCLELNKIPSGINEIAATRLFQQLAEKNHNGLNFIGAGAYEHYIPAAVWDLVSRGEFMTAYTPYQAEASQGSLQVIYEFQTMIASLTGVDIANASLYDGASALAEAILMSVRSNRHSKTKRVLLPQSLHPFYRQVANTIVRNQEIELIDLPYDIESGKIAIKQLDHFAHEEFTALIIPQPNFFGVLEDVDRLTDFAHQRKALAVAVVNPTSLALLKEPGKWGNQGADIVCGEGQPLGVPLASGGPYFGFLGSKEKFVRQLPGRLVGRTVDLEGKQGFVLTLQAREQHIRRSKATSNICTNQGLLMTAATIYLSLMGPEGLRRVANVCHANTSKLVDELIKISGVQRVFNQPFFHEAVIRLNKPVEKVIAELANRGIQAGYSLTADYPELGESLLVCATETKTNEDIEKYGKELKEVLNTELSY